ncbi:hypothetical protein AUP68_09226 [Ilyonectria robusta]
MTVLKLLVLVELPEYEQISSMTEVEILLRVPAGVFDMKTGTGLITTHSISATETNADDELIISTQSSLTVDATSGTLNVLDVTTSTETTPIKNAITDPFEGDGVVVPSAGREGGDTLEVDGSVEEDEEEDVGLPASGNTKHATASTSSICTTLSGLEVGSSYTVLFYYDVVSFTKADTCRLRAYLGETIFASTAYSPLVAEGSAITWNKEANTLAATSTTAVPRFTLSCKTGGSAKIYLDSIFVTKTTPETIESVPKDYGTTTTTTATTVSSTSVSSSTSSSVTTTTSVVATTSTSAASDVTTTVSSTSEGLVDISSTITHHGWSVWPHGPLRIPWPGLPAKNPIHAASLV